MGFRKTLKNIGLTGMIVGALVLGESCMMNSFGYLMSSNRIESQDGKQCHSWLKKDYLDLKHKSGIKFLFTGDYGQLKAYENYIDKHCLKK